MRLYLQLTTLALSLALAPGLASNASAALSEFGALGTSPIGDVNLIPAAAPTALELVFSTSGNDDDLGLCIAGPGCIFGWTGTLSTTGTLELVGYLPGPNAAGSTSCDDSLLPARSCQTNGGDPVNGEVGVNVAMFEITVSGGSPGDMLLYVGDFTLSDFNTSGVDQVVATVPEPNTTLVLAVCLVALSTSHSLRSRRLA